MEYKIQYQTKNKCYIKGDKLKPKGIMLHSTACPGVKAGTFAERWNTYQPGGNSVCVHGFLDDEEFIQTLPFNIKAWHCGGNGNSECIGFEICEPKDYSDREYFQKVKQSALWICARLMKKYNIPIENITSHCEAYRNKGASYASNHADLDHWWKKYFNYSMDDFREELEKGNYRELEYLNVNQWHAKGYHGSGITIANRELFQEGDTHSAEHSRKTYYFIKQIAPEANIMTGIEPDEIKTSGAEIYTTSLFKNYKNDIEKLQKGAGDTICCCAIGNEKESSYTTLSKSQLIWGIGACALSDSWKPIRADYSSVSDFMDFMSFSNYYYENKIVLGTSFASPTFAGLLALVQEFFLKKAGRKLYRNEMYEFIKDNCVDLGDAGKDEAHGYGIFVLPDPEEIDIKKYTGDDEMQRYNSIEEVPEWAKPTIQKLIEKGTLQGDENGCLDLSKDMIRMLVINDREHLYDWE